MLDRVRHGVQQVFTRENVAVKTEAEGNGAERDGHHLNEADGKEDDDHDVFERALAVALGAEDMKDKSRRCRWIAAPRPARAP